ncbi:MAG: hypothetical protein US19_C0035G0023 [Candidatus Daviesbacteria bacterium GW2011_GWB1_36_5]|uniref:Uncharacterized protein n=1 Tax=Candidatus Daviesbacteria bacterium GW2011_GWB1_36_5 TaxID=1618426 RepID=A0A0G0EQY3_9BACT|nr:MAG: hypothetical protein US19_C0035G0023 [Candidatus Daviesbacteria bacterium GW2011_GWB1_36_5]
MGLSRQSTYPEAAMVEDVKVKSFVPDLCRERNWDYLAFRGHCVMAGLSVDTADRLFEGDPGTTVKTLAIVTRRVFGLDNIAQVMNVNGNEAQ